MLFLPTQKILSRGVWTMKISKSKVITIIKNYLNPYPKDIFKWNNKEKLKFNRGRFNEFTHSIVENVRQDLITQINEEWVE